LYIIFIKLEHLSDDHNCILSRNNRPLFHTPGYNRGSCNMPMDPDILFYHNPLHRKENVKKIYDISQ